MSLRYYVLGGVALLCVFYYSREMRDLVSSREMRDLVSSRGIQDPLPSLPSCQPESPVAPPRYVTSPPVPEAKRVLREKTGLEEWIQSRLTQQGLKEMTETDHWQSEQARVL
jgi:hypothetical protein